MFNALQPNFACVEPENERGTVTVEPGGTANVPPNGTCAVLVPIVVVPLVPLIGVVPDGAPPPPPEFASAALLTVTCVSLSIDTILVPAGYDLPELTCNPTARFFVSVTFIVF